MMAMWRTPTVLALILVTSTLIGCVQNSRDHALASGKSAVQLRSIQSCEFDTTDRSKMMRSVIDTLQDLGFVIDKADDELGSVSGTKLDGYALRMTVTVRPRSERLIVRASAQYNVTPVEDPKPYQQFFAALEKSVFLTAQQVD